MILLSIIICTRNRANEVANCLAPVAEQARAFEDVEVIIVDNGSTDDTRVVVEESIRELAYPFRYVYEPIAGLCQARNRGRAKAHGSVLAYIDDDEILGDGWVARVREHFHQQRSDCLGGKIGSKLEGTFPFPVDDTMKWYFCETALGDQPRALNAPQHPNGGNMAFTTDVFDSVGGFDTNLKLYGDETDFFRRAYENQFSIYYDPNVEVLQVIPPIRLTIDEISKKAYRWGEATATDWLRSSPNSFQRTLKILEYGVRVPYRRLRLLLSSNFGYFFTFWCYRGYLAKLVRGIETEQQKQPFSYDGGPID